MFKYRDLRSKRRTKSQSTQRSRVFETPHERAIVAHISQHVAPPSFVIHEIESDLVHLDVHVVPPGPNHEFWFLFTTGMSARAMTKPYDMPGSYFAEVSILLPPHWRMDRESWARDKRWFWPIRELREAALMPHRHETWLGYGHVIMPADITPAGVTRSLDRSTRLSSLIVVESDLIPEEASTIVSGAEKIDLFTLMPIYPEELAYEMENGFDALVEALTAASISDVVDPTRPSALAAN